MKKLFQAFTLIFSGKVDIFKTTWFVLKCRRYNNKIGLFKVAIGRKVLITCGRNFKIEGSGQLFIGHDMGKFPRGSRSSFRIGNNSRLVLNGKYSLLSGHQINIDDNATLELGSGYINHDAKVFCKTRIKIGNNVIIGEDLCLMDSDSHSLNNGGISSEVVIEDNVWIGLRCTVLKGVTINTGSVIAANSLVVRDVPARTLVGGNPARVIKSDVIWSH